MNVKFTITSFLLFVSMSCQSSFLYGQVLNNFLRSTFFNQNVYKTKDSLEVIKVYNHDGNIIVRDDTKYKIVPSSNSSGYLRFRVIDEDESIIRILPNTEFDPNNTHIIQIRLTPTKPSDDPSDYYLKIVDETTTPAKKYLATEHLTVIPVTIPMKLRFNTYDGDSKLSLNANLAYGFGYKIRTNNDPYKKRFFRIMFALGLGMENYIPQDSISSKTYDKETEIALTYALGLTYEFGEHFNLGAFLGWDRMFGDKKDWYYQNKPWLGFGIGFKFD